MTPIEYYYLLFNPWVTTEMRLTILDSLKKSKIQAPQILDFACARGKIDSWEVIPDHDDSNSTYHYKARGYLIVGRDEIYKLPRMARSANRSKARNLAANYLLRGYFTNTLVKV